MKKRLIILCLFVLLIIPFSVKADYNYLGDSVSISTMKSKGWISSWPATGSYTKVGSSTNSTLKVYSAFYFHSAVNGSANYIAHCASIGKNAANSTTPNYPLSYVSGLETMTNASGNVLSATQLQLLKDLLANGYHFDTSNTRRVSSIKDSKESTLSMIAMQVLIWEIMEGGRTTFSQVAPNVYNANDSAYKKYIEPNGASGNVAGSLYYYYSKIINDVNKAINPEKAPAFNTSTYKMKWDSTNKRYSVSVTGLGNYTNCSSNNSNIKINNTTSGITITSSKEISNATISCSYSVGSGTNETYYYFSFKNYGICKPGECQNLVYGSVKKTYTKSFKVLSESTNLKIKKIGIDKKTLSGATFKLKQGSYSVTINGNDSKAVKLTKSGEFVVSETKTPAGYEKISDFTIKIDASSNKVIKCTKQGTDSKGKMTCMNGQVGVETVNNVIVLTVADVTKNFKISKVNSKNTGIKGASFQIKDSNGKVVKFNMIDNVFVYNTSGKLSTITNEKLSTYPIALLPQGNYTIVETGVRFPYRLSSQEEERMTKIKIDKNRNLLVYDEKNKTYTAAVSATVKVLNYTTSVKILKTGSGKPLKGVKFLLYKKDKTTEIKSSMKTDGDYYYEEDQANTPSNVYITNAKGEIVVHYLPVGIYYFKEIETIDPYVLPEGDAAYTKVAIDVTKKGTVVNGSYTIKTIGISNTKNSFNFYKVDEDGNYLSSGKFKLQRYNEKQNRYIDVRLTRVENDGTYNENADIFKEDSNGKVQFTLTNGIATFIDMKPSSRYKIIETVAPEGYIRSESDDTANVTIDAQGNASGLLVLTNQKITKEDSQAQAELVVNIDTGQTRVKYAIIIGSILVLITTLLLIKKKK